LRLDEMLRQMANLVRDLLRDGVDIVWLLYIGR
jgi:hypothetical protein